MEEVGHPGEGQEEDLGPHHHGEGVIGAYHARRVAPLMTRTLPLYAMVPEASFDGTALAEGVLPTLRSRNALRMKHPQFSAKGKSTE